METLILTMIPLMVAAIGFSLFTCYLAEEKGFSRGWWFIWGVLTGPIALLAAMGLPDRRARRK